jgi:hypothetical protein
LNVIPQKTAPVAKNISLFLTSSPASLLYIRAVPPTGSLSDIRIIPGIFSGLVISAEAGKIAKVHGRFYQGLEKRKLKITYCAHIFFLLKAEGIKV